MNDDRDEQIRQRAYKIWQDEGEPHGREQDHWAQAEQEIGGGISVTGEPEDPDAGESGPAASDASTADTVPPAAAPVGGGAKAKPGKTA